MVLELVVSVDVESDVLEAALVLVAELKWNVSPSTLTLVAGAFPKLKVTLVAELGMRMLCDVVADKVPCQIVDPPTLTDIHALDEADNFNLGLSATFFTCQVEPEVVVLNCLNTGVFVTFLDEAFFEEDLLLAELLVFFSELPETLTELLSTLSFLVELPLWAAAIQIPSRTARTTITIPITGTVRRNFT